MYHSSRNNSTWGIEVCPPAPGVSASNIRPLVYGDMVIVVTNNDHPLFHWGSGAPAPLQERQKVKYFTYEEKPDYTPVEISLTNVEKTDLKELALYLNGVCKGATVVDNDVVQLCAYLGIDEKLTEGNVELILYYEAPKSHAPQMRSVKLKNAAISCENIGGNDNYPVYTMTVQGEDMDNIIIPDAALSQNYPNPFNPNTRISYNLKGDGKVSLDIYNVKGQLVKTLYNGVSKSGDYSIFWDGCDNQGNSCASGVYCYRLRANGKTLERKMMLMK